MSTARIEFPPPAAADRIVIRDVETDELIVCRKDAAHEWLRRGWAESTTIPPEEADRHRPPGQVHQA